MRKPAARLLIYTLSPLHFLQPHIHYHTMWTIYKLHLRGFPSHKGYIGVTDNLERRWNEYRSSITDPSKVRLIHRMLKRHGLEAFDFLVLATYQTEGEAYRAEKRYIRAHHTHTKHAGWNVAEGGKDAPNWVKAKRELDRKTKAAGEFAWAEYSSLKVNNPKLR